MLRPVLISAHRATSWKGFFQPREPIPTIRPNYPPCQILPQPLITVQFQLKLPLKGLCSPKPIYETSSAPNCCHSSSVWHLCPCWPKGAGPHFLFWICLDRSPARPQPRKGRRLCTTTQLTSIVLNFLHPGTGHHCLQPGSPPQHAPAGVSPAQPLVSQPLGFQRLPHFWSTSGAWR